MQPDPHTPGLAALKLASYSRFAAIAGVAIPAILQNAAAPATAALQTALLGRYASTTSLAAFAAVSITAGFASRVFNFLVDGVSAKVGKSVGQRRWGEVALRAQLALLWAVAAGVVASLLLLMLKVPVSRHLLDLSDDVLREADAYWWLRCCLVPVVLFNMALSGILQGFHRLGVSALLNTGQAGLELGGSVAVLAYNRPFLGCYGLLGMGLVTLATQLLAGLVGGACVLLLSPREAAGAEGFCLWDAWRARRRGLAALTAPAAVEEDDLAQPLLRTCDSAHSVGWGVASKAEREPGGKEPAEVAAAAATRSGPILIGGPPASSKPWACSSSTGSGGGGVGSQGPPKWPLECGPEQAVWHAERAERAASGSLVLDSSECSCSVTGEQEELVALAEQQERSEHLLDFLRDGLHMLMRSLVIQVTIFASLVAAARLGTASLAAHSIIGQLWMVVAYGVDGFAAAGIVLGSRLFGHAHDPATAPAAKLHLRRLIRRVLAAGLLSGLAAGVLFWVYRHELVTFFTPDLAVAAELMRGCWLVLCLVQPVNGLVFVYDGLMYASQSFAYISSMMLAGLALVFCPLLLRQLLEEQELWGVWLANAVLNVWRLGGAAWLIHCRFMREFDSAGQYAAV